MASKALTYSFFGVVAFVAGITFANLEVDTPTPAQAEPAPEPSVIAQPAEAVTEPASAAPEPVEPEPAEPSIYDTPAVRQVAAMSALSGGSGKGLEALININGHLCAEVTDVEPRKKKDTFDVTCTAYRSGHGVARYRVNGATGDVREL